MRALTCTACAFVHNKHFKLTPNNDVRCMMSLLFMQLCMASSTEGNLVAIVLQ